MVQYVLRIHAKLHGSALADAYRLARAHVEAEAPRSPHPVVAEVAQCSGFRMLHKNPSLGIRDGLESAGRLSPLQRRDTGALWIAHDPVEILFEVSRQVVGHMG